MINPMGKRTLPAHPNPEHLRKQAKARLADMRAHLPTARLADAQYLLAREYGFANWAALQTEAAKRAASPRLRFRRLYVPALLRLCNPDSDSENMTAFFRAGIAVQTGFILTALTGVALLFVTDGRAHAAHTALARLIQTIR